MKDAGVSVVHLGGGWTQRPQVSHSEFPSVKLCDSGRVRPA